MKSRQDGSSLYSVVLLVAANLLIPVALFTFATGFFPYKPFLPGLAQYSDVSEYGPPPSPPFDRLVFMVVDALRSDFVYLAGSGFEYTQSLIRSGAAIPFTAHATSPTVTMPRLKAITTGSIPSFLDVILNLDETDETSNLASQDTWLAQMRAKGTGKLVMYGDDTWLKLFPDTFDRADGTTSFFVSDFTEVDNNVTRHVAGELKNDDWNTMVLHYLGLDHIGHKGGPRSPNMVPKQHEMDGIVEQIFNAMKAEDHLQSTLLVLCGDHGMNEAGNHGASSPGETSPALVFISPRLEALPSKRQAPVPFRDDFQYYSTVEQSDIAPTLAALLGFPVPKNNLGAFIVDFLPFWIRGTDNIQILMRNAQQIMDIVTAAFGLNTFDPSGADNDCVNDGSEVGELACDWQAVSKTASKAWQAETLDIEWVSKISNWLRKAQSLMSSMASNYDMQRLILGQGAAVIAVVASLVAARPLLTERISSTLPFMAITLLYGVMMFGSSYVEEEHHFWYWSASAWLALLGLKGFDKASSRKYYLLSLASAFVAIRLVRGWNQTGQKFAGEPDIVKTFINPNPILLWCLVSAAYFQVYQGLSSGFGSLLGQFSMVGATALTLAGFSFKLAFTNEDAPELVVGAAKRIVDLTPGFSLVARAQAVFIGLGAATACAMYLIFSKKRAAGKATAIETLHHLYTLLAMTQSRTTNIPLFLLFNVQLNFLNSQNLSLLETSTSSLLLSFMSFFAFGGSNSISSVDLSSAYNGVNGYNAAAVGVLTFVSNWAAPIYWTFATNALLLKRQRVGGRENVFLQHVAVLTVFATFSVASVMVACTILRTHLFIWTVFSPKYLYCMAWSLGQHLLVHIGLGSLLFWLGQETPS